jgi:N-acetylglucosaminyl-diphospho-decaprenol L-rhamnosyltransferase
VLHTNKSASAVELSVCIVNWNCRELLRGCLRSLLDQADDIALEVIVVDNASSDGASEMVAREFPQVRLMVNERNVGFARANNQAARLARGNYLLFLNNDTLVPSGTLLKLIDHLEAQPETVVVGPCLRDGKGKIQMSHRRRPTIATFLHRTLLLRWTGIFRENYKTYRRAASDNHAQVARPVDVLMGAALMMRHQDFVRIGGWDEGFIFGGEDMELCYRANERGRVVYLPHVEITHFGRASTRDNVAFAATEIAIGFAQYFRKTGAGRLAMFGYKLAVTLDAPLQLLCRSAQFLVRRALGRREDARQSANSLRGTAAFLMKGLRRFWCK